jgi:hypothetical protein
VTDWLDGRKLKLMYTVEFDGLYDGLGRRRRLQSTRLEKIAPTGDCHLRRMELRFRRPVDYAGQDLRPGPGGRGKLASAHKRRKCDGTLSEDVSEAQGHAQGESSADSSSQDEPQPLCACTRRRALLTRECGSGLGEVDLGILL